MTAALMDWLDHISEIAHETIGHGEIYFESDEIRYKLRRFHNEFGDDSFRLSWRKPDLTVMYEDFKTIDESILHLREKIREKSAA